MQQLKAVDLCPGDIMLKINDGSLTNNAIEFMQKLTGMDSPRIVHGGVMFDNNIIIEASGSGIIANNIRVQNRDKAYIVYRCTNANLAAGAGTCAKMMFDIQYQNRSIKYNLVGGLAAFLNTKGNVKSNDDFDELADRILSGKNSPMFCTQFVVYIYQWVASQNGLSQSSIFSINDAKALPSRLLGALHTNPYFKEVGGIAPNVR
jgi:hypothetical protein